MVQLHVTRQHDGANFVLRWYTKSYHHVRAPLVRGQGGKEKWNTTVHRCIPALFYVCVYTLACCFLITFQAVSCFPICVCVFFFWHLSNRSSLSRFAYVWFLFLFIFFLLNFTYFCRWKCSVAASSFIFSPALLKSTTIHQSSCSIVQPNSFFGTLIYCILLYININKFRVAVSCCSWLEQQHFLVCYLSPIENYPVFANRRKQTSVCPVPLFFFFNIVSLSSRRSSQFFFCQASVFFSFCRRVARLVFSHPFLQSLSVGSPVASVSHFVSSPALPHCCALRPVCLF